MMTWSQAVITYAIAWWMVLFLLAPIGAAKVTDETRRGTWIRKVIATTLLAGFVTWGVDFVIASGIVSVK